MRLRRSRLEGGGELADVGGSLQLAQRRADDPGQQEQVDDRPGHVRERGRVERPQHEADGNRDDGGGERGHRHDRQRWEAAVGRAAGDAEASRKVQERRNRRDAVDREGAERVAQVLEA